MTFDLVIVYPIFLLGYEDDPQRTTQEAAPNRYQRPLISYCNGPPLSPLQAPGFLPAQTSPKINLVSFLGFCYQSILPSVKGLMKA